MVLVEGHPYTVLKKAQLDYVREQLMEGLEKSVDSGTTIPQFQESGLRHGRFHLSCANMQTYRWLQEAVADISVSSEEDETDSLRLQLVTSAEIPKMFRAEVFVSGPPIEVPRFKKLLQGQNASLHMDRWHLRYQRSTDQGKAIVWIIDKDSADALKAIDNRPHFRLGRVTFRVARGPGPSKAARQ